MFPSRPGFPGHLAPTTSPSSTWWPTRIHPDRAAQSIWPKCISDQKNNNRGFPSRLGSPGYLALTGGVTNMQPNAVSIPTGLPRPFCPTLTVLTNDIVPTFPSRTSFPGHLATIFQFQDQTVGGFPSRTGSPGQLAHLV